MALKPCRAATESVAGDLDANNCVGSASQDAHNLAWKIACCHFGLAPHELLETYDAERRPVAMANTELSIQNYNDALQVPRAIGLDPAVANKVAGVMSHFQALLPKGEAPARLVWLSRHIESRFLSQ